MRDYLKVNFGTINYGFVPELVLLAHLDQDASKKIIPIGTAFWAKAGDFVALVTAAHTINKLAGQPVIAIGKSGHLSLARAKIVKSDEFDVAIILLDSVDIEKIAASITCVATLVIQNASDSAIDALYQMHGFPASKNPINLYKENSQHIVRLSLDIEVQTPKKTQLPVSQLMPFSFKLSLKELVNDQGNRSTTLGSFRGMSGSPVYRFPINSGPNSQGNLVGMFIEWHNAEKTAVVLPWIAIEQMILMAADY